MPTPVFTLDEIRPRATITVREAAKVLGISEKVAYESAARGEIPTLRLGHRLLVPVPRLLALLGAEPEPAELADVVPIGVER